MTTFVPMSTDHDWKPCVVLFLREEDQARHRDDVEDVFDQADDETPRAAP